MDVSNRVLIDEAGRIALPADLMDRLGLKPGMSVVIEEEDEGHVRLGVHPEATVLVDKGGILVVRGEASEDLVDAVERVRRNRLRDLLAENSP